MQRASSTNATSFFGDVLATTSICYSIDREAAIVPNEPCRLLLLGRRERVVARRAAAPTPSGCSARKGGEGDLEERYGEGRRKKKS
jgi:hypothetical protein